jgi:hypothetical protein
MSLSTLQIESITHRGEKRWALNFGYEKNLVDKVRACLGLVPTANQGFKNLTLLRNIHLAR